MAKISISFGVLFAHINILKINENERVIIHDIRLPIFSARHHSDARSSYLTTGIQPDSWWFTLLIMCTTLYWSSHMKKNDAWPSGLPD